MEHCLTEMGHSLPDTVKNNQVLKRIQSSPPFESRRVGSLTTIFGGKDAWTHIDRRSSSTLFLSAASNAKGFESVVSHFVLLKEGKKLDA